MMSNEEFDRKMDFIVNQQAQFATDIQQLQEAQKASESRAARLLDGIEATKALTIETAALTVQTAENLAELATITKDSFRVIAEQSRNTDAKIAALVNSQIETEEMLRDTNARLADTNATLRDTNATVRNIGVKFDRHLKEDHNSG